MKIALLNVVTPFIRGGAEILVDDLAVQLEARGHKTDLYGVPQPLDFGRSFIDAMLFVSGLRFDDYDRVISFKFPAYCVDHPRKVLWIFHQFRQIYELFDTEYGFKNTEEGRAFREIYKGFDNSSISKARHIFTNSSEVAGRLKKYNGIDAEVLTPPMKNAHIYKEGPFGDYIFYPSRVTELKRQHLAIEAMKYVKSDVKLLVTGVCESPVYIDRLKKLISTYGLEKKVTFLNRWITDEEKASMMSECLGALYIPYKEDSCGYVTVEAFYSGKPVISCFDSGGTLGYIEEGRTGFFTQPDSKSLAKAMDKLYNDRDKTAAMGAAARRVASERDTTWEDTIGRLLA